jgi:hypothetical protein
MLFKELLLLHGQRPIQSVCQPGLAFGALAAVAGCLFPEP